MSNTVRHAQRDPSHASPIYREIGGLDGLRILDEAAITPGIVVVGRDGEDYEHRLELNWPAWGYAIGRMLVSRLRDGS